MTDLDYVCDCCPYFIDGYCHNCTHEDCKRDVLEKELSSQLKEKGYGAKFMTNTEGLATD